MKAIINEYIDNTKEKMIQSLQEIVAIRSVISESAKGAPYGVETARALDYALSLSKRLGFRTTNVDGHCGFAEYGDGEEVVGIFAHLDVVPEGIGWTYPPFAGEIHNGWIYGRGVVDNKGPAIASLYGLKALKESGLPIRRRIRMVFGINEESGMNDIQYYVKKYGAPTTGFSPDAQFPVSFAEKGGVTIEVGKNLNSSQPGSKINITRLYGGDTPCNIPDRCDAIINVDSNESAQIVTEQLYEYTKKTGYNIISLRKDDEIYLKSTGRTGHPYTPNLAQNAISQLIAFLDTLDTGGEAGEIIRLLNEKIGMEYYGKSLGIEREDESGFLTFSNTSIYLDNKKFHAIFKIYRPYYYQLDEIVDDINKAMNTAGIKVINSITSPGVMIDKNSPVIKMLAKVYEEHTKLDPTPRAVGGTYAKYVPNITGFGAIFPGTKDMCHVVDESVKVDEFVLIGKIYGNAIYELANMEL